jgi:hypothetical protein
VCVPKSSSPRELLYFPTCTLAYREGERGEPSLRAQCGVLCLSICPGSGSLSRSIFAQSRVERAVLSCPLYFDFRRRVSLRAHFFLTTYILFVARAGWRHNSEGCKLRDNARIQGNDKACLSCVILLIRCKYNVSSM